jgi:phospholipid/cholesterol/gamma-HCH transport system ATP-binding protein
MIKIVNVHKSFGGHAVLKGIDLEIPKGAITVIVGQSGEGKSVLLKSLIGLTVPDSGAVLVDGVDVMGLDSQGRNELRKKFGMLFQGAALFDSMNVHENVAFPLREHTEASEAEITQRVTVALAEVGLKDVGRKMPAELSGGMRKRVGLARALILKPEIILYDEPTTGLDPLLSDSVDNLILQTQKRRPITSVVVSHDMQATLRIADKVALLHDGKILEQGSPEEFRKSKKPFVQQFLIGKASPDFVG